MTPRERIIQTLNHQEPDQLAIDFGGMRSTGIHAIAYQNLVNALGFSLPPARLYDVYQQLAEPQPEVLARLGGDVVQAHMRRPVFGIALDGLWHETFLPNGTTRVMVPEEYAPVCAPDGDDYLVCDGVKLARRPASGLYFDQIIHPYQHCISIRDVDSVPLPVFSEADIDFVTNMARQLYETTDKAILIPFIGGIFEAGQLDFGYEDFFANLLLEPELMNYYFDRLCEAHLENLKRLLPRVAPYAQVLQFGDDLGTQQSLQISVRTYREMIKPYHARMYRYVRGHYPALKVFMHSCGAIADLIPDLIDAGVEVLNPVQISAKGMDPLYLKREYGRDLSFWGGGANTSVTVTNGTIDEIRQECRALIDNFAPGGGFVFSQVHNIQPGIAPEKVLAIYDTALAYRAEQKKRCVL